LLETLGTAFFPGVFGAAFLPAFGAFFVDIDTEPMNVETANINHYPLSIVAITAKRASLSIWSSHGVGLSVAYRACWGNIAVAGRQTCVTKAEVAVGAGEGAEALPTDSPTT
jgi:hypothetical protein